MIVVAGEALIDLIPGGDGLRPLPGGSPYNVAVGLGRLGVPTGYLGALSDDAFGGLLRAGLEAAGVDLGLVASSTRPTTLAVVHLDPQGRATYRFYIEATSASDPTVHPPSPLPASALLHVSLGAITLGPDPAGRALSRLLEREAGRRVRSLDPNVRPAAIGNPAAYATRLEAALDKVDVVKVSDEDLAVLYPGEDPEQVAAHWAGAGVATVVLTRGPHGATGFAPCGRVQVPAPSVDISDTVGAGDAFTSGMLSRLHHLGVRDAKDLQRLDRQALTEVLDYAARVAALTCTRPGADPPTRDEVEAAG